MLRFGCLPNYRCEAQKCMFERFIKRHEGIAVSNLHLEDVPEVAITFLTPLTEQTQIAYRGWKIRQEIQRLESSCQQRLTAEELRRLVSLLAFRGELKEVNYAKRAQS